jgi:hypothetical protein
MVLRMLPDVRRAEVRYFRAMLDAGDVAGGVAFDAFVALVRECAAAAAATRDGGARWEGIAATLRQCMDHDEARMVQACEEFDIDHRCDDRRRAREGSWKLRTFLLPVFVCYRSEILHAIVEHSTAGSTQAEATEKRACAPAGGRTCCCSGVIDHEDVARLVRRVDPGVSTADLRFILALLFRADMDDQGSLHIPTLLKALGFLGGSPLSVRLMSPRFDIFAC